jgi:hypothetical protein
MLDTSDSIKYFLYHVNFLINQKEIASEQIIIQDTTKSLILAQDER